MQGLWNVGIEITGAEAGCERHLHPRPVDRGCRCWARTNGHGWNGARDPSVARKPSVANRARRQLHAPLGEVKLSLSTIERAFGVVREARGERERGVGLPCVPLADRVGCNEAGAATLT